MAKKRRRSSVADALNAFSSTYKMTRGVMQDGDMAEAASAKQTEDTGFTVEQGEQLAAVTNAKDENGDAFYNVTATEDGKYQVTPNKAVFEARGASEDLTNSTTSIDPGQRFTFQGNVQDKPFTEAEQDRGRMQAMSGVYAKYGDPVKALDMRQKAGQIEMQGVQKQAAEQGVQLGALQIDQAKRTNAAGERDEAFNAGAADLMKGSRLYQLNGEFQSKQAEWNARKEAGQDPGEAPTRPQYSMADSVHDRLAMTAYKAQHGKLDDKDFDTLAKDYTAFTKENYGTALKRLQGGDLDGALKDFDVGDRRVKKEDVLDYKPVKTKIGGVDVDTYAITIKTPAGNRTINIAQELDTLGKAEQLYSRTIEGRKLANDDKKVANDTRQTNAVIANSGRAAAADVTAKAEKAAAGEARAALELEQNPGASKARLDAVRRGVIDPFKETKNEFSTNTDSMGLTITRTNKDTGAVDVIDPKSGQIRASIPAPGVAAKPAVTPVGTRRKINGQNAEWDGRGWKAVK